jgi:hypothetical protein
MTLRVPDALADTIALVLRDSTQDREHQLVDAVAADIATEIDHVQAPGAARRARMLFGTTSRGRGVVRQRVN